MTGLHSNGASVSDRLVSLSCWFLGFKRFFQEPSCLLHLVLPELRSLSSSALRPPNSEPMVAGRGAGCLLPGGGGQGSLAGLRRMRPVSLLPFLFLSARAAQNIHSGAAVPLLPYLSLSP